MEKLVFDVERVGWSKIQAQTFHDQRKKGDMSHIDQNRTIKNKVLSGSGDICKDVKKAIEKKGATIDKRQERPFVRFVFSASPDFFKTKGKEDPKKVGEWAADVQLFLEKEYGDGVVYSAVHLDEKTPHIHAVVVPFVEKKTKRGKKKVIVSHATHEATREWGSFEKMRRRAAEALGLDYGEPGGRPRTQVKRLEDELEEAREALGKVRGDLSRVRDDLTLARRKLMAVEGSFKDSPGAERGARSRLAVGHSCER